MLSLKFRNRCLRLQDVLRQNGNRWSILGFVFLVSDEKIVKYKFTYMILEIFFVFN